MAGGRTTARRTDEGAATAAGAAAAAAARPPDEGAATAAGAAAAAAARPPDEGARPYSCWRRSGRGRTIADEGAATAGQVCLRGARATRAESAHKALAALWNSMIAVFLARLWASSTFPNFSPSRGQPWLTSTPLVSSCSVTSETAAPGRAAAQFKPAENGMEEQI